ncbi:MAG TPA: PAC2 family protein, partial [Candidatus Limnocylindria bacterium]|nr:PAC2 family protein [Candidatus Limnocylindria bacterium]
MTLYHRERSTSLDSPIVVAAFDGWVDGGRAGTLAADQLAEGATPLATFDADRIYDYRARRPTLDIVDGKLMSLEWPALQLVATRVGDRDLLVLTGAEPDYLWRQLSTDVVALAK